MPDHEAAQTFEPHRRYLTGLAYRMLGSLAEAEDIVQDAYLRWHGAARLQVADPRAYLHGRAALPRPPQIRTRAPRALYRTMAAGANRRYLDRRAGHGE